MQKRKYLILIFGLTAIISAVTINEYKKDIYSPLNKEDKTDISILIHQGDSLSEIADELEEKSIINSNWAFNWYSKIHNLDTGIISGRFLLNPSMTIPEILSKISTPSESEAILTIQEGLTIKDIDKKLSEMGLIKEGNFITATKNFKDFDSYKFLPKTTNTSLAAPLEGYIFPDTYFLEPVNFDSNDLIYKALNNFSKKITPLENDFKNSKHSMNEIVTMASIIEKEIRTENDRPIVSGILWKRLNSGWKLDADATLLYTKDNNKITTADLNSDSPYNTRKIKGLPPTPICNPSIENIKAALNPIQSEYWFYLTAKDGTTIYAKTNEEHNTNKKKYL